MSTRVRPEVTLRDRQRETTREQILSTAMRLLSDHCLSHEAIAVASGMSARTVYRHFASRDELIAAMWEQLRDQTNTRFPASEQEILTLAPQIYRNFDRHAALVRAVLFSGVGSEVRDRGAVEGKAAFQAALSGAMAHLPPRMKRKVIAVFLALYSAPAWQLMRDRGQLSAEEAAGAVEWALSTLLESLRCQAQ